MEILTRKSNLVRIKRETEETEIAQDNVCFYKKTEAYRVVSTPNYVEILSDKKVYLGLFRKLKNVHVIAPSKSENINPKNQENTRSIYLVGDKWVEHLEDQLIENEIETQTNINDSCMYKGALILLLNDKMVLYSRTLKKIQEIPLELKYAERMSIIQHKEKTLMGILSISERRAIVVCDKQIVKDIKISKRTKEIKIVEENDSAYIILADGNKIRIVGVFDEKDTTVETDHIGSICQIEHADRTIYTASPEGIICTMALEEKESTAVYVDSEGILRMGVY